ncbi:hypothetical protein QC762_209130 [Podospora pseudocomata]|uniref:Transmembrane protein n=1 Tax=Podospora pseudocomata TaxID=2093779 RepID=A0ABR0GMX4_9PEZI|nr:hypothetical protein QC762_209130 [Podospora pseudocomata]
MAPVSSVHGVSVVASPSPSPSPVPCVSETSTTNGFRNLSIDTDDHSSTRASRIIAIAIAAIVTTIIVAVIVAIVAIFTAVTAIVIAVIPVLTVVVAVTTTISSISITIASTTIVSIPALVILMLLIIPMSSHHLRHLKASGSEHAAEQRAGKFVSIDSLGHQLSWGAARDRCHGSSEPDRREEGDGGQKVSCKRTFMVAIVQRV